MYLRPPCYTPASAMIRPSRFALALVLGCAGFQDHGATMSDVNALTGTQQAENVSDLEKPGGQRGLKYREDFARTSEEVLERLDAALDLARSLRRDFEGFV